MLYTSVQKPFFFQAEDGIQDDLVTGVQTCALPIYLAGMMKLVEKLQKHLTDSRFEGKDKHIGRARKRDRKSVV